MAYSLTTRAKQAASESVITPNLVFCIEGYDKCFGTGITKNPARFGYDGIYFGMPDLVFGGMVKIANFEEWISLTGTTDTISTQLDIDKGAATGTQNLTVRLIDVDGEITRLISPGVELPDVLYRNCSVFLGLSQTAFPNDYLPIFNGKIQQVKPGPGYVDFVVSHPEDIKRSECFIKAETVLTQRFSFNSKTIQDLFYQQRGDVLGTVQVEYINGAVGQNPTISLIGNLIQITIESGVTQAKSIKKKIENDENANQLVTVSISGTATAVQVTQAVTNMVTDTTISVDNAGLFLNPVSPILTSYARINDELIKYTSVDYNNNQLLGCTRAQLNTFGATHDQSDEVFSFYELGDETFENGSAINLALSVMLSGGNEYYSTELEATNFEYINPSLTVQNAVFFPNTNLPLKIGIVEGDFITITGASVVANNCSLKEISEIVVNDQGTYLVVSGVNFSIETNSSALASFKSKYNILPSGIGLVPNQVDVEQFELISSKYFSQIALYRIYLKETINGKDFIDKDLFLPSGMFSLPRKGRISAGIISPPLYDTNTKILDIDTVKNPSKLRLERGINRNFYNAVVYKYNEDSIEEKALSGIITLSADSTSRINAATKPLSINAKGIRKSISSDNFINRISNRYLLQYQYGAESTQVEVPFKIGWTMEVGDSVIFGDPEFQIADTVSGSRDFKPRIFEIRNKSWNWKTGNIQLQITDTNYTNSTQYAVWSPSSIVGTGSTTTSIVLTDSFGSLNPEPEKWQNFIGYEIIVRNDDFTTEYSSEIQGFDPSNTYKMIVSPALGGAPAAGWTVQLRKYEDTREQDNLYKQIYLFFDPTLTVTSGVSVTQFNVSLSDAAKLYIGSLIQIHNDDYTTTTGQKSYKVTDISGTLITVDALPFIPAAGQKIELVGFATDNGKPYAWF